MSRAARFALAPHTESNTMKSSKSVKPVAVVAPVAPVAQAPAPVAPVAQAPAAKVKKAKVTQAARLSARFLREATRFTRISNAMLAQEDGAVQEVGRALADIGSRLAVNGKVVLAFPASFKLKASAVSTKRDLSVGAKVEIRSARAAMWEDVLDLSAPLTIIAVKKAAVVVEDQDGASCPVPSAFIVAAGANDKVAARKAEREVKKAATKAAMTALAAV
jgi:hypothetical protein